MEMHSNYCVGCGPSVGGVYRSDINWDLCDDCYSDWIDNERTTNLENAVCCCCTGTYIRYSMTEEDFCCWDCGSKDYRED